MSSRAKSGSAASPAAMGEELGRMAKANGAAMEVFTEACQAYANGMASLNGDMMSFVKDRAARDAELGQALCRCGDWTDVSNLQQDWAKQTAEDYLNEAERLMTLASKVANESWEPARRRASEALVTLNEPKN